MKIGVRDGEVILSEIYSGVGIETDMGLFGIVQRDGGIEVMLDGDTVWTSHEITDESERTVPGELGCDVLASGVLAPGHFAAQVELGPMCTPVSPNGPGVRLPDGSGVSVASFPLPKDHWLYAEGRNEPPPPVIPRHYADDVRAAARYAIRASTMNGKEADFDPDAMVQNVVVGLLGRWKV